VSGSAAWAAVIMVLIASSANSLFIIKNNLIFLKFGCKGKSVSVKNQYLKMMKSP
jgi:hypothetical protein